MTLFTPRLRHFVRYPGAFTPGLLATAVIAGPVLAQAPRTSDDDSMMMGGDPMAMGDRESQSIGLYLL